MMFISKFNKLIRNRIMWGIFAFIIVISFVAWGTFTGSGQRDAGEEENAGKLYGKAVSVDKFRREFFNTYLSMSLMFGRPLNITGQLNDLIRKLTWRRMAVLQTAAKLGLSVSPDEVAGTIEQQPFFVENGQFNRNRYQAFVQTFLAKVGATEAQFEQQVSEELLINKARFLLAQAVWISPMEVAQVFSQIYDTFVVSYLILDRDDLRNGIKVSDQEARQYFTAHREDFKIPETMRVKYVCFPFKKYLDKESLSNDVVRAYYDENIEQYSVKTTNGWLPTPYEKVKDEICEKIALENAVTASGDKALDFEILLAPDRSGKAPAFEEAVRTFEVSVQTSRFFSLKGKIPGLEVGNDFNQTAFNLRPTSEDYFSHPVRGSNAFYVIAYDQRRDARLPEYAEVKNEVMAAAVEKTLDEKLERVAGEIHRAGRAGLEKGKTLAAAMRPFGVEVITTEAFSAKSGFPLDDEDESLALLKAILLLNAGELSEIIPLEKGIALVRVESRKPAEQTVFKAIRNDLEAFIKRKRVETAFYEWQEYLLKDAGFEDLARRKTEVPEEDVGSGEESDI